MASDPSDLKELLRLCDVVDPPPQMFDGMGMVIPRNAGRELAQAVRAYALAAPVPASPAPPLIDAKIAERADVEAPDAPLTRPRR